MRVVKGGGGGSWVGYNDQALLSKILPLIMYDRAMAGVFFSIFEVRVIEPDVFTVGDVLM